MNIVFHVAATVKFNEKLKIAVELNVVAVRRVLEFAKKIRHGVAFVHTSTAYAHTNRCVDLWWLVSPDPIAETASRKLFTLHASIPTSSSK